MVVKVARLYDYAGEFKVSLVPPANVKDVTAAEVVIPAGKDEATLVLTVPGRGRSPAAATTSSSAPWRWSTATRPRPRK